MGTATSILGLKINKEQLYTSEDKPGCEHEHESKFCPSCGAEASHKVEALKSYVTGDDGDLHVGPYEVWTFSESNLAMVVLQDAVATEADISEDCISLFGKEEDIKKFQTEMERVGLWDPNAFGVWASYEY